VSFYSDYYVVIKSKIVKYHLPTRFLIFYAHKERVTSMYNCIFVVAVLFKSSETNYFASFHPCEHYLYRSKHNIICYFLFS